MKTKEYVNKYKLNKDDKFDHSEFVSDLTIDFMTLLEVGKASESIKGFENSVRAIRMKFNAINNKTVGCIPEKLWRYFFATVIAKMREGFFPVEMEKRRRIKEERERAYEERRRFENDFWGSFGFTSFLSDMFKKRIPTNSFLLLGLSSEATVSDVKTAYRKASLVHHPDKGGKESIFVELTEAKNKCLMYLNN